MADNKETQPAPRTNWPLLISFTTLLAAGGVGLIGIGRMVEAKADRSTVEGLQHAVTALTVESAATSRDVERILTAIERMENKIDRAQAREGK